jgi:subtilisin family serine protease
MAASSERGRVVGVFTKLLGSASILAASAAIVASSTPLASAAPAAGPRPQDSYSAAVLDEINKLRTDPQGYARKLKTVLHGKGVGQAIAILEKLEPLPPLEFDGRLTDAAGAHAADEGPQGKVEHTGSDGSTPAQRMRRAGVTSTTYSEVISMAQSTPEQVVFQLISDGAHLDDLIDPNLKLVGVGCGPNAKWGHMCVVDMTNGSLTAQSAQAGPAELQQTPVAASDWAEGEVLVEVPTGTTAKQVDALDRREGTKTLEQFDSTLTGTTFLRSKIVNGRPVPAEAAALAGDPAVLSAQPNFLFSLQAAKKAGRPGRAPEAAPLQYAAGKLHLSQAHALAKGDGVLVAVIDTGVDAEHPELKGAVTASYDALGGAAGVHGHGTGVAAAIAAHGRLLGSAPDARILAVRAFDPASARGVSFHILKGLDWSVAHGARVVNMSFAGPQDPALHRGLEAAWRKGVVLIAAAGNAGPKSPPLYPGAEPHVIAVTATDVHDRLYAAANRGPYIAVAAPGVDVLEASPQGGYQLQSGTSFSAAEVSGVAALMLQRKPAMTPDEVRGALVSTSLTLPGEPGQERLRLVDALKAISH